MKNCWKVILYIFGHLSLRENAEAQWRVHLPHATSPEGRKNLPKTLPFSQNFQINNFSLNLPRLQCITFQAAWKLRHLNKRNLVKEENVAFKSRSWETTFTWEVQFNPKGRQIYQCPFNLFQNLRDIQFPPSGIYVLDVIWVFLFLKHLL